MTDRIRVDPEVCSGQACIKGTRLPVSLLVNMMANGDTAEDLLDAYPGITPEDLHACLEYAAASHES